MGQIIEVIKRKIWRKKKSKSIPTTPQSSTSQGEKQKYSK